MNKAGRVTRVVGALAEVSDVHGVALNELVRLGHRQLLAEVLRVTGDMATVQIFEETAGVRVGEPVLREGLPLTIELGPGLLGSVIDGIGRPLGRIAELTGDFIQAGTTVPTLDRTSRFRFNPACAIGDRMGGGDILGTVTERSGFALKVLMPPGRSGVVRTVHQDDVTITDALVTLDSGEPITAMQKWPVRRPRPVAARIEVAGDAAVQFTPLRRSQRVQHGVADEIVCRSGQSVRIASEQTGVLQQREQAGDGIDRLAGEHRQVGVAE